MKNAEDTKLYKCRWLILLAFAITIGLLYWFIDTRMIVKYIPIALVGLAIGCASFSFAGVFIKKKCFTWAKWIFVVGVLFLSLYVYHERHTPDSVRMQEDVLYIKPASMVEQEQE